MKVTLIAQTYVDQDALGELGFDALGPNSAWPSDSDILAEFAGRSCYQSFDRPNPATAENDDYLKNIEEQGHFSVLEHASATFYITGISRALTHELIRHRHFSYSQQSQRFVNEESAEIVIPPAVKALDFLTGHQGSLVVQQAANEAQTAYKRLVDMLTKAGCTRKEAREAARAVLPNATETRIVVTGNMRAWREFILKRNNPHADAEIRELASALLAELREVAPNSFQDL